MCVAVPGKMISRSEVGGVHVAQVQFGGIMRLAYLDYLPDAAPGDYLLVQAGFAIGKVDAAAAEQDFEVLAANGAFDEELELDD